MKRVLYIVRRPPGGTANEFIDVILVSGAFEQRTSVLFADAGAYQLVGLDARDSPISSLPAYDITNLYVAEESLTGLGIAAGDIPPTVRRANRRTIRQLIARHDVVLTD